MTDISEKQKKKAEKLLNGLKTGQQKIPTAVAVTVIQTVEKEVVKRIDRIKNNLEIMSESKGQIIEEIKKIDDTKIQKEYLNKAETLTRADIKSMRERVSPDYSEKTVRPSDSESFQKSKEL